MIVHALLFLLLLALSSPVFFPMQYPVAVGTEGDALLGCFLDGFFDVAQGTRQFIDGSFVGSDYVVEVDYRNVFGSTVGTDLFGFEGYPFFAESGLADSSGLYDPLSVLSVPPP
jgi:hypothetical protein